MDTTEIDAVGDGLPVAVSRVLSPYDAHLRAERERTRRAAPLLAGASLAAAGALPFLGGSAQLKLALYIALAASVCGAAWLRWLSASQQRYQRIPVATAWLLACSAVHVNTIYFGVFSAGVIPMFIAVYYVGMLQDRVVPIALYTSAAALHAGVAFAAVLGRIEDPGIMTASSATAREQLLGVCLIQGLLLLCLLLAAGSRAASLATFEQLRLAALSVAQREAMVLEAAQELAHARARRSGAPLRGAHLGSFLMGEEIGRGGMGEVYRATRTSDGEAVAVKVLNPLLLGDSTARKRFAREARLAASLDSVNVVRIFEVSGDGSEQPYIAMELLRGQDLGEILRERGQLSLADVLRMVRQVANGLEAAAAAGVAHRDIKPHNLLLAAQADGTAPIWKILDFGISRSVDGGDTLTRDVVLGTPAYLAPEHAQGLQVDHRADLYSLAAVSYRALTGFPPFSGKDARAIVLAVLTTMPRRPTNIADLPVELDAFFAVALAKEPDARFASAQEFLAGFEAAISGRLPSHLGERARKLLAEQPWA